MIYTYRMILGDFDTSAFGEVAPGFVVLLFILCTIFNMIVMLNLLIAIISDSYARVNNISQQATYQERCILISENQYLIPDERKKNYAVKGKYLMVVTDLEKEKLTTEDPIIVKIKEVSDNQIFKM
jgi:hypothetical protein